MHQLDTLVYLPNICFITLGSKTFCEAEENKVCESDEFNFEPDEEEEEATHEDKEKVSPKSVSPKNKKGKKKKQTGEFLLRVGKPPQPLNVS